MKNNTPEQKAAWQNNKKLGSAYVRVISSESKLPWPHKRVRHKVKGSFAVRQLRNLASI